jgi:DNA-binding protein HU-beta
MYKARESVQERKKEFVMNKEELVQEIARKAKVTQKDAAEVLGALIDTIQKTVAKKQKVTLVGFGTWEARKRAARTGRNPQTGKELKIPARTVPAFSAGKKFKTAVNGK